MNVSAYYSIPVLTERVVNALGTSRFVYGAVVDVAKSLPFGVIL